MKNSNELLGDSEPIRGIFESIAKVGPVNMTVLIEGETGTGKELVARAIHAASSRARGPFVAVNSGAMPQGLIYGELFGHVKGAFTGADEARKGRFSQADGGTLFLDEIGTMEEHAQVALLRVLETGRFRPVGAASDRHSNARIIGATNMSLDAAISHGEFRADLAHRFGMYRIKMPPLRERPGDISLLAHAFVAAVCKRYALEVERITPEALALLEAHAWPGNVRELKNFIAECCLLASPGPIKAEHLPREIVRARPLGEPSSEDEALLAGRPGGGPAGPLPAATAPDIGGNASGDRVFVPLGASLDEVQKAYTLNVLEHCRNNKSRAAELLNVSRKTLYGKLTRWGYN